MAVTNTPKLDLLRIQGTWKFGDEAFNRFIDDADDKLLGISHISSPGHWGVWKKKTSYSKDDIVRITNGKSNQYYKCITAGVSGTTEPTENTLNAVVTDATVKWKVMEIGSGSGGSIKIWTTGNNYDEGEVVIYGTALYRCKTSHKATTWDNDYVKWQEIFASIRLWEPEIYYFADDTVIYGRLIYKCKTAHISDTTFTTTEEDNWEVVDGAGIWEWQPNKYYPVGSLAYYDDIVYKCVVEHTSTNDFYTDRSKWKLFHNHLVKWKFDDYYETGQFVTYKDCIYRCNESHSTETFYIIDTPKVWATNTAYFKNDLVIEGNILYRCKADHTSTTFSTYLGIYDGFMNDITYWDFIDDLGKGDITWTTNTYYYYNDVVLYGGRVFVCTSYHESTTFFGDISHWKTKASILDTFESNKSKWDLIYANIQEWSQGVYYKVGSIVLYRNNFYKCITNHKSALFPFDKNNWELLHRLNATVDDWETGTQYLYHQLVMYGNMLYRCKSEHLSDDFDLDAANWESMGFTIPLWKSKESYKEGNIVIHEGRLYRCNNDNNDTQFSGSNWDYINAVKTWEQNKYYPLHTLVVYNGGLYRSIASHKSTTVFTDINWEPLSGEGGAGGFGSAYSQEEVEKVRATSDNPYKVDLYISSNSTHTLAPIDVLKKMDAIYLVENMLSFNPSDASKFSYKYVKFDGGVMKVSQSVDVDFVSSEPLGENFLLISDVIDLSEFKSINSLVVT